MDDDSSRKLNKAHATELYYVNTNPLKQEKKEEDTPHADHQRIRVLYSHSRITESTEEYEQKTVLCDSFDDLLNFLEEDLVETIWFDESVEQPERSYITGWAKIFRPDLEAQILTTQKQLH